MPGTRTQDAAYDLIEVITGLLLGDKGYIRPVFKEGCDAVGIDLQTPLKKNMKDNRSKKFVKLIYMLSHAAPVLTGAGQYSADQVLSDNFRK